MSEPDPNLPEVPHEGAPYQGYGPAPYQPPVPVPPPAPPGFAMPYQQAPPNQQPPPPAPPTVSPAVPQQRQAAAASPDDGEVLQKWGYVMAISTLIVPILAVVGLILGTLLAVKPHRQRHGITIIAISIALGLLTVALWAGFYDEG